MGLVNAENREDIAYYIALSFAFTCLNGLRFGTVDYRLLSFAVVVDFDLVARFVVFNVRVDAVNEFSVLFADGYDVTLGYG